MTKKIKKYKVGTDSETYAISMVEMPAIESDFVALAKEEEEKMQAFLESDERHMVYGAALIPDKDIYRNNGEQEFYISFTKESIEKMSQDFMKNYRQNEVTLDHEEMANDITVTESWLVEDPYKDKANALGINVPKGTWMVGMKVNQIDVWERIKNGELKGFSVESMISLEEFSKQNQNNMEMTNEQEMNLFEKFKKWLTSVPEDEAHEEVELEGQEPTPTVEPTEPQNEPTVEPTPTVEPQTEPTPTVEEPKVEEPTVEEPKVEEPKNSQMEELVNSLKAEIEALKESNNGLVEKIKEMGKQPSAQPVNTNAKNVGVTSSTYSAWREQMRSYLG